MKRMCGCTVLKLLVLASRFPSPYEPLHIFLLVLGPGTGLVSFPRLVLYPLLFHFVPSCLVSLSFPICRAVNVTY